MITKNKIVKIIELAKKCNECALHHFKKFDKKSVNYKDDNSPLTKADVEVNNIAVYGLQKLFPNIEIISEEFYNSKHIFKNNKYFWLIDPIDGTKEFINKSPNFTVNFALVKHNLPIFGLIAQPTTGTIWYNFNNKAWKLDKDQDFKSSQIVQCKEINYKKIKVAFEKKLKNHNWLIFKLKEGKNREIRNICNYFSWNIVKLIRIGYGPYKLGRLKEGQFQKLNSIIK